jgi:hypothetical protein
VLQKNAKLYGPTNVLDSLSSSSWNSEGGQDEQWLWLNLGGRSCILGEIRIQFQAGFVAQQCQIQLQMEDGSWKEDGDDAIELEDVHDFQSISIQSRLPCKAIKLIFQDFTDFYGRVIVYQLQVWGTEL